MPARKCICTIVSQDFDYATSELILFVMTTLDNGLWRGEVACRISDLTQNEAQIKSSLGSQVATYVTANNGDPTVTVSANDVRVL